MYRYLFGDEALGIFSKITSKALLLLLILASLLYGCSQNASKVKIAILTPVTHPSLEQIERGFIETMEQASPGKYVFTTFNAQGNKSLMHSEIEEIIRQEPALVFTLGTSASQMTVERFTKKKLQIPIVFTCVNDPVTFQIVHSEISSGNMATGIKELVKFKEELAALIEYKPNIKKILLVYNPSEAGLDKQRKEMEQILNEQKIALTSVEIYQTNELLPKLSPFITQADALVVLKDNLVVSGLDFLIKLCNQHKVPLMASDLDSPDKGAAFGYGVYERDFGVEGAHKALQVLEQGIAPTDIPITPVTQFTLKVNPEAARKQGIDLEAHP